VYSKNAQPSASLTSLRATLMIEAVAQVEVLRDHALAARGVDHVIEPRDMDLVVPAEGPLGGGRAAPVEEAA